MAFLTRSSPSLRTNFLSDGGRETASDLMLAQMLQMQYDREFDDQLRREEKKFNGDSKGRTAGERKTCGVIRANCFQALTAPLLLFVSSVHLLRELPHGPSVRGQRQL